MFEKLLKNVKADSQTTHGIYMAVTEHILKRIVWCLTMRSEWECDHYEQRNTWLQNTSLWDWLLKTPISGVPELLPVTSPEEIGPPISSYQKLSWRQYVLMNWWWLNLTFLKFLVIIVKKGRTTQLWFSGKDFIKISKSLVWISHALELH